MICISRVSYPWIRVIVADADDAGCGVRPPFETFEMPNQRQLRGIPAVSVTHLKTAILMAAVSSNQPWLLRNLVGRIR